VRRAGDCCSACGWDVKHSRRRKMDVALVVGIWSSEVGLQFGSGGEK